MTIHRSNCRKTACEGFTLVEVALTIGIVAGTALVVIGLLGTFNHNVSRIREPQAKPRLVADSAAAPTQHPLPGEEPPEEDGRLQDAPKPK